MVVMDQYTRRNIGFAVHQGDLCGFSVCCMFNKITRKNTLPKYLSSDHDTLFTYYRWQANLRILEIDEVSYVRFASVYRKFTNIDKFASELKKLKKEKRCQTKHP